MKCSASLHLAISSRTSSFSLGKERKLARYTWWIYATSRKEQYSMIIIAVLFRSLSTLKFSRRLTSVQNCDDLLLVLLIFSPAVHIYDIYKSTCLTSMQSPLPIVLYLLVAHGGFYWNVPAVTKI